MLYFGVGFLCGLLGLACGILYEAHYGYAEKERERYQKMIYRMIPYLRKHYTNDFIYYELINNDARFTTRTTNT